MRFSPGYLDKIKNEKERRSDYRDLHPHLGTQICKVLQNYIREPFLQGDILKTAKVILKYIKSNQQMSEKQIKRYLIIDYNSVKLRKTRDDFGKVRQTKTKKYAQIKQQNSFIKDNTFQWNHLNVFDMLVENFQNTDKKNESNVIQAKAPNKQKPTFQQTYQNFKDQILGFYYPQDEVKQQAMISAAKISLAKFLSIKLDKTYLNNNFQISKPEKIKYTQQQRGLRQNKVVYLFNSIVEKNLQIEESQVKSQEIDQSPRKKKKFDQFIEIERKSSLDNDQFNFNDELDLEELQSQQKPKATSDFQKELYGRQYGTKNNSHLKTSNGEFIFPKLPVEVLKKEHLVVLQSLFIKPDENQIQDINKSSNDQSILKVEIKKQKQDPLLPSLFIKQLNEEQSLVDFLDPEFDMNKPYNWREHSEYLDIDF